MFANKFARTRSEVDTGDAILGVDRGRILLLWILLLHTIIISFDDKPNDRGSRIFF